LVTQAVAEIRRRESLDAVIVNAENAAGGSGLTPAIYRKLIEAGVDGITLGDHIYRRKEIYSVLQREHNIVKPANFPAAAPGKPWTVIEAGGVQIGIVSLLGRVFMRPVDCPFLAADRVLEEMPDDVKVILVDFHAEATSDKQLMGRYLDGRVSAVLGTHTHVPTADERILPGGTAFQCDVGMSGPYDSILGREVERVMETTITFRPTFFDVAKHDVRLCGAILEVDPASGRASQIERYCLKGEVFAASLVDEHDLADDDETEIGPAGDLPS
jgi:metallophosphoesterase (TIGR00282 family)